MNDSDLAHNEEQQETINKGFEDLKIEWDDKLKRSGKSQTVFIATDAWAIQTLAMYQEVKDGCEENGFTTPEIFKGIKVNIS